MKTPTACCLSAGILLAFASVTLAQVPANSGDWPQWRGPDRSGVSLESGLLKEWPKEGPKLAWQIDDVGVGYSSITVKDGRIFTQGDLDGVEHIICVSVKDGSRLWAVQPEPVAEALAERLAAELKRLDTNGDGLVDEIEGLPKLGWKSFNNTDRPDDSVDAKALAEKRAANFLNNFDKDGDGKLTYVEAGQILQNDFATVDRRDDSANVIELTKKRTADYFDRLDKDIDEKIDRQEAKGSFLDRQFNRIDQRDPKTNKGDQLLTSEEIESYLAKSQSGKDGVLDSKELSMFYGSAARGRDGVLSPADLKRLYGGYRNGQGDGPRGTPTVDEDRVYVEGGNGDLTCLNAANGKTIWHLNLIKAFGGGRPGWGYCESPLVVDNLLIVTPGGKQGTLVALDKMSGEVIWRSEGVTQSAHYSSPIVVEIDGLRQIVQFGRTSMFGVTLSSGEPTWSYSNANNGTANVATPIVYKNHVFASSSYGTGGGLAKISTGDDGQKAEEVYFEKKMANHHGGIVRVGDYMYGFGSGGLICMNFLTGEIAWVARSVGKGSLMCADGMLYCLGERYEVALVEANPKEYVEHGRFKIESFGRPSWAHPVVVGGRFYIRNQHRLAAYDVKAN